MIGRVAEGPISTDVLVIGGGAAGAMAALAARERGLRVDLVRRAWASTALSSGTVDVAGDALASPSLPLGARHSIADCARYLASRRPDHPYAVLADRLPLLDEALAFASGRLGGLLQLAGALDENRVFLSPLGLLKTAAGGLLSIAAGDLLEARGTIGIVGFDRHLQPDPHVLAMAAADSLAKAKIDASVEAVECDFLRRSDDPLLRPHEIAARIEAAPEQLAASIERAIRGRAISRLLFPPVLSSGDASPILRVLEGVLGIRCAELPAGALSVPGVRLQRALEDILSTQGVNLWHGDVFADSEPGRVAALERLRVRGAVDQGLQVTDATPMVEPSGRPPGWPIDARAVVLATGRFLGGGIRRNGRLRETVLDLPVWIDGRIDEGRWLGDLTRYELREDQPALRAGLRFDAALRPLLRDGRPASERLFACGDVLAGNDPAFDGAGLGLAFFTGWLAGLEAAKVATGETPEAG
ncbi:FAD-binding protein [Vulgatibacter incomptus]|uniref:Anaerobic glycerol-3-phosphate dehydrogenase subunit B n=1 Tax=Vulgatibacter incomptus TaxID=1391653 RepID=A0A0K1P8Q7_9BACT|nr:FAD-binding protein [Vulgatibacter incomptus]AKU89905.1 Anaerobic glycerol-3-phosphate dehydrogenase subunit B [Vulgatibacter incomptus]